MDTGKKLPGQLLEESISQYIAAICRERVSRNTVVSYERDLRRMANYFKGQGILECSQVTETHLCGYLNGLEYENKRPATVARAIASIKAFFRYLQGQGAVLENPATHLKAPKIEKGRPYILTPQETVLLLKQPQGPSPKAVRDRAMLELMYATGIRVSELVALQVTDVNMGMEYLICRQGGRERVVPFGTAAAKALQAYMGQARPQIACDEACGCLFTNMGGKQMSRQGVYKMIKQYAAAAGIAGEITPHTLRHSFAAHLVNNGADLCAVQEMMGYADLSAAQVYAQMRGASIREVYKKAHPRGK